MQDAFLSTAHAVQNGARFAGDFVGGLGGAKDPAMEIGVETVPAQETAVQEGSAVEASEKEPVPIREFLDRPGHHTGAGIHMSPVLRDSDIVGMRVHIPVGHFFERLGIRDGDVIWEFNGTPVNGPEALFDMYRVLRKSRQSNFLVERDGQQITLTRDLR